MRNRSSFSTRTLLLPTLILPALLLSLLALGTTLALAQNGPGVTSGPRIWLQANKPLPVQHVAVSLNHGQGMQPADSSTLSGLGQPLSLTAGDVDADGFDDLVVGYSGGSGGFISIDRGNIDAFAPQSEASFQAIGRGEFPAPFLPDAKTFSIPISPDFVALGNFTGRGNQDLAVAAKGGSTLYIFANDGKGNFSPPQTVTLADGVTALAAGEFGRSHSVLMVGGSHSLGLYVPSPQGLTALASYPAAAPVSNIQFGELGDPGPDVAFLSGGQIQILRSSNMQLTTVVLPVSVGAFALGTFLSDRNPGSQIALLAADGSIQFAVRNEFDPRPYTSAELVLIKQAAPRGRPNPLLPTKSFPVNGWKIAESFPGVGSVGGGQTPVFFRTRVSNHGADDVMMLNPFAGQLVVISHPDLPQGASTFLPGQVSLRPYTGTPIDALPMRVNVDGRPGVVALHQGEVAPSLIEPIPDPTFFVNTTLDPTPTSPITNACNNTSFTDISSSCSLREAVLRSNGDTIMLQALTYSLTIGRGVTQDYSGDTGALYVNHSATIVGASQTGTIIQWGTPSTGTVDLVMAVNQDVNTPFTSASASISNLTIQGGVNHGTFDVGDGFAGGIEFDTGGTSAATATATLTLTNVTVTNNSTTDGDGGGLALFNSLSGTGFTTLTNSIVSRNSPKRATSGAAGAGFFAGTSGPARFLLSGTSIIDNTSTQTSPATGNGGGIFAFGPGPTTSDAIHGGSISGNETAGDGGGINTTAGLVIDTGAVISNNTAGTGGGGANGGNGGGLWFDASGEDLSITDATITGNTSPGGTGTAPGGGGIYLGGDERSQREHELQPPGREYGAERNQPGLSGERRQLDGDGDGQLVGNKCACGDDSGDCDL